MTKLVNNDIGETETCAECGLYFDAFDVDECSQCGKPICTYCMLNDPEQPTVCTSCAVGKEQ